jgi:hypothetical protein
MGTGASAPAGFWWIASRACRAREQVGRRTPPCASAGSHLRLTHLAGPAGITGIRAVHGN